MTFPVKDLMPALPRLSPIRAGRLLREMGVGGDAVTPGQALLLWLAHWLAVTQPVPPDQQDLMLYALGGEVVSYGDSFEEKMRSPGAVVPVGVVSILDRTFAVVSGQKAFLCLEKGEYVDGLARPPVESISYNLAAMYAQVRARSGAGHGAGPGK